MTIDQEIAIRCVLVLAHPRFEQRRASQGGEPSRQNSLRYRELGSRDLSLSVLRIERRAMCVDRKLESAAVDRRHAVGALSKCNPRGHVWRSESQIAGRRAEEEDLLPTGPDALSEQLGK